MHRVTHFGKIREKNYDLEILCSTYKFFCMKFYWSRRNRKFYGRKNISANPVSKERSISAFFLPFIYGFPLFSLVETRGPALPLGSPQSWLCFCAQTM